MITIWIIRGKKFWVGEEVIWYYLPLYYFVV